MTEENQIEEGQVQEVEPEVQETPEVQTQEIREEVKQERQEEPLTVNVDPQTQFEIKLQEFDKNIATAEAQAADLKKQNPDVIISIGALATLAATTHFPKKKIIFTTVLNLEKYNFTKNKNVCGISLQIPLENSFTQFKMLAAKAKNVGVFYNPANTSDLMNKAKVLLPKLGMKLAPIAVNSPDQVSEWLKKLSNQIDSLWMLPDPDA